MFIKDCEAKAVKNSRGEKSIEITLSTLKGSFKSSAPSGKSKGKNETPAYNHRGVDWSLKMLNVFFKRLKYKNFMIKKFSGLSEFEKFVDEFEKKFGKMGANATYALETAFLKASAKENNKELWEFVKQEEKGRAKIPMPIGNCVGGGLHSSGNDSRKKPDFQEFLLIPKERTFSRAITKNIHAYEKTKNELKKQERKWLIGKNDENAWKTSLTNDEVLEIMYQIGKSFKLSIGIDVAASSFFKNQDYNYENKKLIRDKKEQVDYLKRILEKYSVIYIEDGMQEEDFSGFADLLNLAKKMKKEVMIVGDDLTTTNLSRLKRAVKNQSINAVIIKPNQNGSLLKVAEVVLFCKQHKLKIIFSHRSGETMDDALADYAVGFGAEFIKTGIDGKERLIKLRRIVEIERSLRR